METPGHRALRTGRASLTNHVYHVTLAAADRRPVFQPLCAARIVVRSLNDPNVIQDAQPIAWCLMPDHLHWLLQLGGRLSLSALVQRFKSISTKRLHKAGHDGEIWAMAFHDHGLRREEDLADVARYIVANPVRAGLVKRVSEYPHWDAMWLG